MIAGREVGRRPEGGTGRRPGTTYWRSEPTTDPTTEGIPAAVGNAVRRTAVTRPTAVGNAELNAGPVAGVCLGGNSNVARSECPSLEIESFDQEHRHLAARVRVGGAVEQRRDLTSTRDVLGVEPLDPVGEEAWTRDVAEDAGADRRRVARAVLGLQEEHRHLRPR